MTNDLMDKNVNHYKSLMGYVVLTVGIHPENPHDVRLVMAKRNPESERLHTSKSGQHLVMKRTPTQDFYILLMLN